MELLNVLIGGFLVAAGYALAKIDWKHPDKPEHAEQPETKETAPELPKSGISLEDQLEEMQSYDPKKARKQELK